MKLLRPRRKGGVAHGIALLVVRHDACVVDLDESMSSARVNGVEVRAIGSAHVEHVTYRPSVSLSPPLNLTMFGWAHHWWNHHTDETRSTGQASQRPNLRKSPTCRRTSPRSTPSPRAGSQPWRRPRRKRASWRKERPSSFQKVGKVVETVKSSRGS